MMEENSVKKYDSRGNIIYEECSDGFKHWCRYDKYNNRIYFKETKAFNDKFEFRCWYDYDKYNNLVHFKSSWGFEHWYKYDYHKKRIRITEQEFEKNRFKRKCEKRSYRFEIMDI